MACRVFGTKPLINENAFESVICEMVAILSRGRWVNSYRKTLFDSVKHNICILHAVNATGWNSLRSSALNQYHSCNRHGINSHGIEQICPEYFAQRQKVILYFSLSLRTFMLEAAAFRADSKYVWIKSCTYWSFDDAHILSAIYLGRCL